MPPTADVGSDRCDLWPSDRAMHGFGLQLYTLQPLTQVVGLDGDVRVPFNGLMYLNRNGHPIADKRFQRFISVLQGKEQNTSNAQLRRDHGYLLNQKELGQKALKGTRFPFCK